MIVNKETQNTENTDAKLAVVLLGRYHLNEAIPVVIKLLWLSIGEFALASLINNEILLKPGIDSDWKDLVKSSFKNERKKQLSQTLELC